MPDIGKLHPYLRKQLRGNQLPHAFVFTGKAGEQQAFSLAAALECADPNADGSACGHCPSCRNLLAGTHPDVFYLAPVGNSHKAEAMRDLVSNASQSRFYGHYRIFILSQAERMSVEGANTLLKLLEEPVPGTVLILLSEQPDQLLATILSRCQLYQFNEDNGTNDPLCPEDFCVDAENFLRQLPTMPLYAVLMKARDFDGKKEEFRYFLYGLLQRFHAGLLGKNPLPMDKGAVLDSAEVTEKALTLLSREINQKILADVVLLRLRRNCL